MKKIAIKNRKGQKIVVLLEEATDPKGLAFVMHGWSGNKEEPHIQTFAESFKVKGYTVVRFDTTNTFGESDGKYEDSTVTTFYSDLSDVIGWAKTQSWYTEPFVLAGHSLGGIAVLLYAENHPKEIKGLAPISTVISGKLSIESRGKMDSIDDWKRTGWIEEPGPTSPTGVKRAPWSHMEDRLKYDVRPEAHKLTMPVLFIVGDRDESTPVAHQKLLFNKVPGKKEFHIIKGSPHSFVEPEHLKEVKDIFKKWIDKLPSRS